MTKYVKCGQIGCQSKMKRPRFPAPAILFRSFAIFRQDCMEQKIKRHRETPFNSKASGFAGIRTLPQGAA
jgi:hypothetical protein